MGGKTGTTSSTTKIPPEVMARYKAVNERAENVAAKPFQQYGTTPDAFVAQLNEQQKAGQAGMNQYANAAQPVLNQVQQGYTPEGFSQGVKGYMNPYLESAVASTRNQMQNVAGQQQAQMKGSAIGQGAFGGDRSNIGMGNLINQQNLALGQTIGGMESQGFQNAAQNYMAGLGQRGQTALAAQQAGLQGSQAQIGAGTLGQQTEQAGKTAQYNQFLQEQAYPYQVAQFLANVAMGTGALSGSSTTTTQPMSFFSDERLKEGIEKIGKTFDGQDIIKFRYKGEDGPKQIGLSAQNVEKHHPEAVGLAKGYKTVDYDAATKDAAKRGHFEEGGLVSEGGAVGMQHMGQGFADGGGAYDPYDPYSIYNILSRQQGFFGDIERSHVPSARGMSGGIGKHGRVPEASLPVGRLMTSEAPRIQQDDALNRMQQLSSLGDSATKYYDKYQEWKEKQAAAAKAAAEATKTTPTQQARGGLVGYATGGMPYDLDSDPKKLDIPDDTSKIKLPDAKNLPGTMQDPTMSDIMKIASMFSKASGGRAGYATDGAVDDRFLPKPEQRPAAPVPTPEEEKGSANFARSVNRTLQFEGGLNPRDTNGTPSKFGINQAANPDVYDSVKTPSDASQVYYNRYWKPLGADQMDPNLAHVAFDTAVISGVGRTKKLLAESGGDPEKLLQLRQQFQDGLIAQNPEKYGKYEKAWNNRVNQLRTDIGSTLDFPKDQPQAKEQGLAGKTNEPSKKESGFGDFFTAENVIPVLTGLAGMASSRSPFLGSAILEGLGAGANAYMGTQKSAAEIAQAKAATKSIEQDTELQKTIVHGTRNDWQWVRNKATGNKELLPLGNIDYTKYEPSSPGDPKITEQVVQGKEPTTVPSGLGGANPPPDQPIDLAQKDKNDYFASPGQQQGIEEANKNYRFAIDSAAQNARNGHMLAVEQAKTLASVAQGTGVAVPGFGRNQRSTLINVANTVLRAFGESPVSNADRDDAILRKLETMRGGMAANEMGQRSLGALEDYISANPNSGIPIEAAAPLMAQIMVGTHRSVEQKNHMNDYASRSAGNFQSASADFEKTHPTEKYTHAASVLSELIMSHPEQFQAMAEGTMPPEKIAEIGKKVGVPDLPLYFKGF